MKVLKVIFVVAAFVMGLGLLGPAQATYTIDFAEQLPYSGGTVGAALDQSRVKGINIPFNQMQFSSGSGFTVYDTAYSGTMPGGLITDGNGSALANFDTATNSITITGYIPALGMTSNVTLLSGSFSSWTVNTVDSIDFHGVGPDQKDATLLSLLGVPAGTAFAQAGYIISTNDGNPNTNDERVCSLGVCGTPYSSDIPNRSVPEPGSLLLLGLGLIGLGVAAKRKMKK